MGTIGAHYNFKYSNPFIITPYIIDPFVFVRHTLQPRFEDQIRNKSKRISDKENWNYFHLQHSANNCYRTLGKYLCQYNIEFP